MLTTLAISNYRSLLDRVLPLGPLNVITGPNASGKSNLYRALRLLAETARGGVVQALAREGGLDSTLWAGPPQAGHGKGPVRLNLGFAGEEFGYAISLGMPKPDDSAFSRDPKIKRECIWAGPRYRPASALIDRQGCLIKTRAAKNWEIITDRAPAFESMFTQIADPARTPELFQLRETIRGWRFRTDHQAPARSQQLGTRTPVLAHDGSDIAAALQTIREIGDADALQEAIDDAFPGSSLSIGWTENGRFSIEFQQPGLLRPLSAAELSDGTLRYILWIAALLTPRPPSLMVLNEPETSLHPDLLPALAHLIVRAAETTQVWVVSHSARLIGALNESEQCLAIELEKDLGETNVVGQSLLDQPAWEWPK
jgi:predicted ATPase